MAEGLDMYLSAKTRVDKHALQSILPALNMDKANYYQCYAEFNVGYWRKANAIHQWIVENIQDGHDNCGEYNISRDSLRELKELCQKVIDNPECAEGVLPTQPGFLFGGLEYDEWYFRSLKDTITIIDYALSMPNSVWFKYNSSW